MQTRRFDFNWKPLQISISFTTVGSVPDNQNYNADSGEYTPDYGITPLVIQPSVGIIDKDGVLPSGNVNHLLTNIRWCEIVGGVSRNIASSGTDYEYETSGSNAGRLKVKKNVSPEVPVTLRFYGEFIDGRNNQINVIRGTYSIRCNNASDLVRVELDAAGESLYNPLIDADSQTVSACVYVGDGVCNTDRYILVWELLGSDDTWHTVGSDDFDWHVSVGADGASVTVNRRLMGDRMSLRCRCRYSAEGNPSSVVLDDSSPSAMVSFVRRVAKYEYDIVGVPTNIPAGSLNFVAAANVSDSNGTIAAVERELLPVWYIATNKASGTLSYTQVGHGIEVSISTTPFNDRYGAVVCLDVIDRGCLGGMNDNSDDSVITDSDGTVVMI